MLEASEEEEQRYVKSCGRGKGRHVLSSGSEIERPRSAIPWGKGKKIQIVMGRK